MTQKKDSFCESPACPTERTSPLKSELIDTGRAQESVNDHASEMLWTTFLKMENLGLHSSFCFFLALWVGKNHLTSPRPTLPIFKNEDNNSGLTVYREH